MDWNKNLPPLKVFVRNEFLYDQQSGHGEFTEGWLHAIRSIKGLGFQFYVLLETGALFTGLPLHALCVKKDAPKWELAKTQLWDNLSYDISVIQFDFIKGMSCEVLLKDKTRETGSYIFTVDYAHPSDNSNGLSETPNEWKSAHFIELNNGNIVAYPPNRILFKDASLIDPNVDPSKLGYKVNTHYWYCEDGEKYTSFGDSDEFFYKQLQEKGED
jgi:hypothetical protein